MENSRDGIFIQNIDTERIKFVIGLMNLTYNMFRKVQLVDNYVQKATITSKNTNNNIVLTQIGF